MSFLCSLEKCFWVRGSGVSEASFQGWEEVTYGISMLLRGLTLLRGRSFFTRQLVGWRSIYGYEREKRTF